VPWHENTQTGLPLEISPKLPESDINRLKLLKRQGYGRAAVQLLRQRLRALQ